MYQLKDWYLQTIDETILFLQSQNATLTHHIASRNYLPEASRFAQLQEADMLHAFGTMGNADKAKHFATLYLEDMSDFNAKEGDLADIEDVVITKTKEEEIKQ